MGTARQLIASNAGDSLRISGATLRLVKGKTEIAPPRKELAQVTA
jgi:hypothetical protein